MQALKQEKSKTTFQQYILELSKLQQKVQTADLTLIALIPNTYDKDCFDSYEDFNQYFMKKFYHAICGQYKQQFGPQTYQKVTVQDVDVYIKQFQKNDQLIRLLYIPAEQYDLSNNEVGSKEYLKMVKKFFLSNLFMRASLTDKIKLVAMDFISKPAQARQGKLKTIDVSQYTKKLFEKLQKSFNLGHQQQRSKLAFLFVVDSVKDPLVFKCGDDDKNSEISKISKELLIMTKDDVQYPVFRLEKQKQSFKAGREEILLVESENLVKVKNYHLLFHYNQFLNYTPTLIKDNILDQLIVGQLWGVIQSIIYPLFQVKQLISYAYLLPEQEYQTKDVFIHMESQRWNNPKLIKNDLYKFNEQFGLEKWREHKKNVIVINDDSEQQNKNDQVRQFNNDIQRHFMENSLKSSHNSPIQQKLTEYTKTFNIYNRFIKQQPNCIHSMILDQINTLSKDICDTADEIHKATEITKQFQSQRKLLQLTKIIVRFLSQLKKYAMFSQILEQYDLEFNQYLLDIYLAAYAEFCSANKQIYGKLFDLSQKVADLKSTKKQILKVVKSMNSFTQLYKLHTYIATFDDLQDKRLLLEILLRLLKENRSQQKDKQTDTKIMSTQYDLGSTYYKIALIQNYGQIQSKLLKKALKIMYNDLYQKLFILRKDFDLEYAQIVNFNEIELLEKISGLLKLLDSIELSIEVEKKLDNITAVQNYYNRWLMKYHRLHGETDQKMIISICQKAIEYFTTKYQIDKVIHFYDMLIKNSMTFEEKSAWKTKRFIFLNSTRDSDWCKKGMEKAEKTVFPITIETNNTIHKLYIDLLKQDLTLN